MDLEVLRRDIVPAAEVAARRGGAIVAGARAKRAGNNS
jgi:hypothetical protein